MISIPITGRGGSPGKQREDNDMATLCTATDLGSVLRHHRQSIGHRPEQVAVHVGRSVQTVMQWELNKRVPTLTQLGQLACLYDVDIGELATAEVPSARAEGASR